MPRSIKFSDDGSVPADAAVTATSSLGGSSRRGSYAVNLPAANVRVGDDVEDDEDEDDAPVEESVSSGRQQVSQQDSRRKQVVKEANLKRKRAEDARAASKQAKQLQKAQKKEAAVKNKEHTKGKAKAVASEEGEKEAFDIEEDKLDADLDGDGGDETAEAPSSSRLDPSLFAAAFARQAELFGASSDAPISKLAKSALKQGSSFSASGSHSVNTAARSMDPVVEARRRAARRQRIQDAKAGIVRGHDGKPMKRLADGRTVVRALGATSTPLECETFSTTGNNITLFDHDTTPQDREDEPMEEGLYDENATSASSLDPLQSKPNARARAFLKRNLKRKGGVLEDHPAAASRMGGLGKHRAGPRKTIDDPLGLEDPFLMKGGAYASQGGHAKLTGAAPRNAAGKLRMQTAQRGRHGGGRVDAKSAVLKGSVIGRSAWGGFVRGA
ncbi:hypothetical protein K437DRAFT_274845 [Tilletiaria anomala UBC 951]|uniref:Uncharacterized protein n=1 Tax=Tilletiaria anomala (strain ATCC 24038 / CBS 436.72 / UBC 951) TaxID=1037660 RepID=A0A066VYQ7_TILAU|nr:uncharacterized protein K437DRAFT_274845 [Tilletiaria anomala UBC 951]KDN43685.1 hypothetical protein K437DRAFT_274845 [Tilletiaria anomala UBC 951]